MTEQQFFVPLWIIVKYQYLIILFQILSQISMLTKILEFHNSNENFINHTQPTLYLPKDTYEDYLAFMFQSNEGMTTDNHTIYLQKVAFDSILESFQDQQLLFLQQKQDMYICYIMHSTLKNTSLISQGEFFQNITQMFEYFSATQEEKLLVDKIQSIVKASLLNQTSPFTYIQVCKDLFSEKLQIKLIDILKFMIGDSLCYKMAPASIFGICLKWTTNRYGIKNQAINELIGHLIDLNNPETGEKIGQLNEMMNQIMNMK